MNLRIESESYTLEMDIWELSTYKMTFKILGLVGTFFGLSLTRKEKTFKDWIWAFQNFI